MPVASIRLFSILQSKVYWRYYKMKFVGETTQKLAVLGELTLFQPSLKDSRYVLRADADAPLALSKHAAAAMDRPTDCAGCQ